MNDQEFCNCLKVDTIVLSQWIDEGWILPAYVDGMPEFRADIARGHLILDLMDFRRQCCRNRHNHGSDRSGSRTAVDATRPDVGH
ncbi:hypothetical protein [Rhizobium giardinii]|uniref:hypothetical protein n=1 Tax=Rhizobium giardinii TaxID=56731 RepID=UPI003D6FF9B0